MLQPTRSEKGSSRSEAGGHQGEGQHHGAGVEQQKENRDASIAGKSVPGEALVMSSRMTHIIKRKWSTTYMTINLCITPKGKTDCNYSGISCESRILGGPLIL